MKIWAIARITFKECLRYRVVYFILAMALMYLYLGKGCNPGTIRGEGILFDKESLQHMATAVAFHGIVFWSMMLCGLMAANVLSREIDEGTAVMTLCRPVGRTVFTAGKILSVLMIACLNMFLLGGVFLILLYSESGMFDGRIFISFIFGSLNLVLFALMCMFFSMFLPRLVVPLVGLCIYAISIWNSLPFYFQKLSIIWDPSQTVRLIHTTFPPFGDLQFIAANLCLSPFNAAELAMPFVRFLIYCAAFWFLTVVLFKRKHIQ